MQTLHIDSFSACHYHNYFSPRGNLSNAGKSKMWHEIDRTMKKFNLHEIELKP